MRTKKRAPSSGYVFGLAGAVLALPVAGIAPILPLSLVLIGTVLDTHTLYIPVTNAAGEQESLLRILMVHSARHLPSALLLGFLAGCFHRVTNSIRCTALLGFGSLALVALAQPYFIDHSAEESQYFIKYNSLALGGGSLIQCLAVSSIYAKRTLPVGIYQAAVGAIIGLTAGFFAALVLDFIFIYAAVVHNLFSVPLTLGIQAGLLNRFTKSNFLTALLSFASVWFGFIGPLSDFAPNVPELEAIGIGASETEKVVQGLLFQWMAISILCAVRLFRKFVWKR